MKVYHTRWILILIFSVLIIIDIIDGRIPKIITTVLVSISVVSFSFGYTNQHQRIWFIIGYIFGLLAIAGFVYRLVIFSAEN